MSGYSCHLQAESGRNVTHFCGCRKEQGKQEPQASRLFSEILSTSKDPSICWDDTAYCWGMLPAPMS